MCLKYGRQLVSLCETMGGEVTSIFEIWEVSVGGNQYLCEVWEATSICV